MKRTAEPWVKEPSQRSSPGRGVGGLPENPLHRFFLRPWRGLCPLLPGYPRFRLTGFTAGYSPAPLPGLRVANEPRSGLRATSLAIAC